MNISRALAAPAVARVGVAGADDSTTRDYLTLQRRRLDLEKRRQELRRS